MAKANEIMKPVHRFYRKNQMDLLMFGFVTGIKRVLPSVSITQAIDLFQDHYQLTEPTDFNCDSARITYNRMRDEFENLKKDK